MSSTEPSRKADDDDEAAGGPVGEDDKESQQAEGEGPVKEDQQHIEGEESEGNQPSTGASPAPAQSAPANAVARYPPSAGGQFYPPYPTNAEGAPMYPPPRGYENQPAYVPGHPMPPYGPQMPPHQMGPYPMYHPYQHAMYPPPHYPPYAYGPRPYEQAQFPPAAGAPYPPGQQPPADQKPAAEEGAQPSVAAASPSNPEEGKDEDGGPIVPGAVTARLKTYIKPRVPSTQDVMDRRSRKNAQSRARAAKLRERIGEIQKKNAEERTEEERELFEQFEARRRRKNDRSRERALEKKEEIDRILTRPDKKRSKIEKQFLDTALSAKKRKNEGDRLRRQRLKELGLSSKGSGHKPGISARGPLPKEYQHLQKHSRQQSQVQRAGPNFGEIPVSPLPTMPHHHAIQSPGVFPSPGMMPNMSFPSPSQPPRHGPQHGVMETPGRNRPPDMHRGLQFIPPPQGYDHSSPGNRAGEAGPGNSRVEQRTNPDGSMSISIGRGASGEPSFGGEARLQGSEDQNAVNMADVTHLLIYSDNGDGDDSGDGKEKQTE